VNNLPTVVTQLRPDRESNPQKPLNRKSFSTKPRDWLGRTSPKWPYFVSGGTWNLNSFIHSSQFQCTTRCATRLRRPWMTEIHCLDLGLFGIYEHSRTDRMSSAVKRKAIRCEMIKLYVTYRLGIVSVKLVIHMLIDRGLVWWSVHCVCVPMDKMPRASIDLLRVCIWYLLSLSWRMTTAVVWLTWWRQS